MGDSSEGGASLIGKDPSPKSVESLPGHRTNQSNKEGGVWHLYFSEPDGSQLDPAQAERQLRRHTFHTPSDEIARDWQLFLMGGPYLPTCLLWGRRVQADTRNLGQATNLS
ncbi:hypothetical protein VTK73DRAFT_2779 [Phialemonium thermophilum]|uniref:Uncharacterized protein n=1 Tax=Phialemonium thermophilum TaxID=223376 RepID=A0ABR3X345_9PEZI